MFDEPFAHGRSLVHAVDPRFRLVAAFVCAVCLAVEALAPERIAATPVQVGSGTVTCAHGELHIPAPATAAILDSGIPVCAERLDGERCTPTSAALIKHFVDEFDA